MSQVTIPTPVAIVGVALCILGGYLVGVVLGPEPNSRTTAEVVSYAPDDRRLCLTGDAVAEAAGAEDGVLCGTWRRDVDAETPLAGDSFRFVTLTSRNDSDGETATFIYGDVVR